MTEQQKRALRVQRFSGIAPAIEATKDDFVTKLAARVERFGVPASAPNRTTAPLAATTASAVPGATAASTASTQSAMTRPNSAPVIRNNKLPLGVSEDTLSKRAQRFGHTSNSTSSLLDSTPASVQVSFDSILTARAQRFATTSTTATAPAVTVASESRKRPKSASIPGGGIFRRSSFLVFIINTLLVNTADEFEERKRKRAERFAAENASGV
ncbi:hypothetical protein BC830DRAFT_1147176 [Chytriomyces sp. MP71]|nr:hypothetical protein BC830DRAFT_1147176 [Chytriomyces sp. MP71]